MKTSIKLTTLVLATALLTACGSSSSNSDSLGDEKSIATSKYQTVQNEDGNNILLDNNSSLMWINNVGDCFEGVIEPDTDNCTNLVSGEYSDWRYPTKAELSKLIKETHADNTVSLEYANSICVVGTASDGWVKTHNSNDVGAILDIKPGNAGLRCVRDIPLDATDAFSQQDYFTGQTRYFVNDSDDYADRTFDVNGTYSGFLRGSVSISGDYTVSDTGISINNLKYPHLVYTYDESESNESVKTYNLVKTILNNGADVVTTSIVHIYTSSSERDADPFFK